MNIEAKREDLLKAINIAESILSSKNVNQVLTNCMFDVTEERIGVISTDNEIAVRTFVDVESDACSSFLANGKKLSTLLRELNEFQISMNIDDSKTIQIKSKNGNYKLVGMGTEEYPVIQNVDLSNAIEFEQSALKDMLKKTMFSASSDTIKPVFNGIYFVDGLTVVSTDSRRLTMVKKDVVNMELEQGVIIPLKTIYLVYKLLDSGVCYFAVQDRQCFFKIGETEIISRLVDGRFPNYEQVIPTKNVSEAVINTKQFLEAVRRVIVFASEPAYKIVMKFSNDKLVLDSDTAELGFANEKIDIEYTGDDIELGINGQFLLDALKEFGAGSVTCGINGAMSPFTLGSRKDFISIIMPIQIKREEV